MPPYRATASTVKIIWVKFMRPGKKYTLEYWIEATHFSEEQLNQHVKQALNKFLVDVNIKIQKKEKCFILQLTATEKIIEVCYDKLKLDREWSFRSKDELGDLLRSEAYPILAEIELQIRNFINQSMVEVSGFDWWHKYLESHAIGEKVKKTEKAGNKQAKSSHQVELTFFDDLLGIVTAECQIWNDEKSFTVADFHDLLSKCNSIEDMQKEVESRRKKISLWDDVFSNYFDDKKNWIKCKETIKKEIIPIRNKVMHHQLIHRYELKKVEECRGHIKRVLGSSKNKLSDRELEELQPNIKIITDELQKKLRSPLINYPGWPDTVMQASFIEAIQPSPDTQRLIQSVADLADLTKLLDAQLIQSVADSSASLTELVDSNTRLVQKSIEADKFKKFTSAELSPRQEETDADETIL